MSDPVTPIAIGRLDPRAKLFLLGLAGLWAVLLERPASLLLCAGLAIVALCLSGGRPKHILGALGGLALAVWGFALMQAVFYQQAPRTPWFAWHPEVGVWRDVFGPEGLALYREGFLYGLTQGLRLVLALGAGLSVAFSTDASSLLSALRFYRVPYGIAFMAVTSLRFLPLLGREASMAWQAARMRGFSPFQCAPWTSGTVAFSLLRPVLASCVRRASVIAASVTSRGFTPEGGAVGVTGRALSPSAQVLSLTAVAVGGLVTVALLSAKALYMAYLHEVCYSSELRPVYEFVRRWL
jgi:energy-coupling factor transporter transmembrane protein EcfT